MIGRAARVLVLTGGLLVGCRRPGPPVVPRPPDAAPDATTAVHLAPPDAAPAPAHPRGTVVTVLHSANLLGEYEAHPLGGLARRATVTAQTRAEGTGLLQVDAGDTLLPPLEGLSPDRGEIERRARLLASGLGKIGLDAWAPGETDRAYGPAPLKELARKTGLPLLAANLRAGNKPWLPGDRLVRVAGVPVGIFAVVDLPADKLPRPLAQTDPTEAARAAVASLRARGARVVIGLAHLQGGVAQARQLARTVDGIDLLVVGHDGETLDPPAPEGRTRLVEAHRRGTYLGRVDLDVTADDVAVTGRLVALLPGVAADPALRNQVRAYVDESKRRADKQLPSALAPAPAKAPDETWQFGSNGACVLCHDAATKQFKTTAHASALQTLQSKGRGRDRYCFTCHTTGFAQPGGTRSLDTAITYFGEVGCESCHGPSVRHVRLNRAQGTRRQVPESVCLGCHRRDQQPEPFDYRAALTLVLGPGHGDGGKGVR